MSVLGIIGKKLKVAGNYYKTSYDDKYLTKRKILGQCDFITQKIRVCKYYKSEKRKELRAKTDIERTVYHEILHSIDGTYNNYGLTEKETTRLSVGLHQVMGDNFTIKVKKGGI